MEGGTNSMEGKEQEFAFSVGDYCYRTLLHCEKLAWCERKHIV